MNLFQQEAVRVIRSKTASRPPAGRAGFERVKRMAFLWTFLALALNVWSLAPFAHAQGSRKDDVVFNSRGVPLGGATVRVCSTPATGQPCSPLALIYSDAALTQALANPTTSDGLGNYFFYASPGKYMIEISGPGITTRQIPNVILPSDPTAPSFSSVSSTGGISAFSLNLSGNMTVTGNATVVGSLAGGTLNLTNQGVAPGTASTGTVNLYTKNDKRLYYKDDGGTEIGPIANTTGAQTNVTNTFTAQQNFDANTASKGPNPWFDITRYGGFASTQQTTGSMTTGTATLTLTAALDFANGQGIVVYAAGANTTLTTPGTPTVTPIGVLNGTTTYNYQIACEDYGGSITAASATGSTTTGVATLGAQTATTLTSAVRTSGVVTFTTPTAHNLQAGQPVNITGFTDNNFNGSFIIVATPLTTTFTVNQSTAPDATATGTGSYAGLAYNKVVWTPPAGGNILRCWIYRNSALVGVQVGVDGYYEDYGFGLGTVASYVPTTPPAAVTRGYLTTTISSGGGTTTLTLAANAGATVTTVKVLHDNTAALNAAQAAAVQGNAVGVVYVPNTNGSTSYSLNSTWVVPSPGVNNALKFLFAGGVSQSQPIVLNSGTVIEGTASSAQVSNVSFGKGEYTGFVAGIAAPYPFFLVPCCKNNITLRRLNIDDLSPQEVGLVTDDANDGSGSVDIFFDNDAFTMGAKGVGVIIKGGFGFYFDRSNFSSTSSAFGSPYALRFTDENYGTVGNQVPGAIFMNQCWFGGAGILVDDQPKTKNSGGLGEVIITNTLYEAGITPFLRVNLAANGFTANYNLTTVDVADFIGGFATPMVDITNTTGLQGFKMDNDSTVNSSMPLIVGSPAALTIVGAGAGAGGPGAGIGSTNFVLNGTNFFDAHNVQIITTGAGINVPIAPPTSTPTATVSAGGSVPVGTWTYKVTKVDFNGKETTLGPASAGAVITTGNQTVTVSCTDTVGGNVQFLRIYRSNGGGYGQVHVTGPPNNLTTCSATDTAGFTDGSPPTFNAAGDPSLDGNGVAASKFRITGELVQAAPRAEQNVFLPGALTTTWTGSTWTLDKAITVTRVEAQAKTAPAGCTTNAVVRLTDGTTPVNVTISAAANSSGAIAQNYAAAASMTVGVTTAAAGCTTNPADVNVTVQYRMQ